MNCSGNAYKYYHGCGNRTSLMEGYHVLHYDVSLRLSVHLSNVTRISAGASTSMQSGQLKVLK